MGVKTVLQLPLFFSADSLGVCAVRFDTERTFSAEELDLAKALVLQGTLAVEVARLTEQAQEAAVAHEREAQFARTNAALTRTLNSLASEASLDSALGEVLATTGQFTRYADTTTFVPEVIRTPGYPAFVAAIYLMFGVGNNMAVAVAQAFVFAAICLMVFYIARRTAGDRSAVVAGAMTALYPPLPYFGSLIVTELWTAFMATAAILICLRAAQTIRLRDYVLAGALFTATTMVRPAFVLMPFFFAIAVPLFVKSQRTQAALKGWAALFVTAALALSPWLTYNYVNFGHLTLSPAGGIGRGLWEGSWQG